MKIQHLILATTLMVVGMMALIPTTTQAGPAAQGGAPTLVNYQGYLTDSGGQPLNGTVALKFGLYTASSGGSPLWEETHNSVSVSGGYFSLLLGSITPLSASDFSGATRYLQVSVDTGGGFESLPRQQIAAVPYALQAVEAQNAWSLSGNSGTTPGSHFLGTTDTVSLTLVVNGSPALRLEPGTESPSLIGGYSGNSVTAGVYGATIGGGGRSASVNRVTNDYGTIGGGRNNAAGGYAATVGGGYSNTAGDYYATVSGGEDNTASGEYAVVGGGVANSATGDYTIVSGGESNIASDFYATVGGGRNNAASGSSATVGGGIGNATSGDVATVGGGSGNTASGGASTVGGGYSNATGGYAAIVGGGGANSATNSYATVSGGTNNAVSGNSATVGGGNSNTATNYYTTVSGGVSNIASGSSATVGGGGNNAASESYATVGGGYSNATGGYAATVGGGGTNSATNSYATVSGGTNNAASGNSATVGGGNSNTATNYYATVSGGRNNAVSGSYATVGGGTGNTASGDFSIVPGGIGAVASHYGEMVYASGRFASNGDAQTSLYVLRRETYGLPVLTELFLNGTSERITLASYRVLTFDILIVGKQLNGANGAGYQITGVIKNMGGSTSFVGTPTKTVLGEDTASWDVQVVADDTNDALVIKVLGANGAAIRWVASVRTVEVQ